MNFIADDDPNRDRPHASDHSRHDANNDHDDKTGDTDTAGNKARCGIQTGAPAERLLPGALVCTPGAAPRKRSAVRHTPEPVELSPPAAPVLEFQC